MDNNEMKNFGEDVAKTQNGMKELVFDESTGEFRTMSADSTPTEGSVVTGLTEDGFAA